MTVLRLHFKTNTPSYASDTKKILGVALMLLRDALDWFGKATDEDVEFCLDYAKFKAELMATGEDCNTRYYALNSLLEIQQGSDFQGSNLWGVPENSQADSLRAQQGEPTTGLGLTLQYNITIFQGLLKVRL
ncbi:hypothetical protein DSO57_1010314 [Entomophthora muscae]|uniref:Uncharacterized protein n=1 Tax=Entomophthora muscae TaxID=34485 RepID=A0ACC2SVR0_9FUNG|nr:hypothetical protein DSO57_1010314 [Entomophthora muscae]